MPGGRCDLYLKIRRCLKRHNFEIDLTVLTVFWRLRISGRVKKYIVELMMLARYRFVDIAKMETNLVHMKVG